MNAPHKPPVVSVPLDRITRDEELQPRSRMDETTWEDYLNALVEGATFPPVTLYNDGQTLWLADGYHRWHAHRAAKLPEIMAEMRTGTFDDALQHALSANAGHGKRRERGDYQKAYGLACKYDLVAPYDAEAVKQLLNCSMAWAFKMTEAARAGQDAERNARIRDLSVAGASNREIGRELGIPSRTVDRAVAAPKINSRETAQPTSSPVPHPAQAEFDDMTSLRGERWGGVYDALLMLNKQARVEDLFADRYTRLDHAIGPALDKARAWINELHARFFRHE